MKKFEIGKFMVLLQDDGSLKIVAIENKEKLSILPVTANSCTIVSS